MIQYNLSSNQVTEKIYTVSHITRYIKKLFNSDPFFHNVTIIGEISNFKYHSSGHMYFILKDEQSQIRCVMFKGSNIGLDFYPSEGTKVKAIGDIRVYEKRGEYQFYVFQMTEAGKGALFAAFEALKEKLRKEGLFDKEYKSYLPKVPHKFAIVTSPTGAAIRDIISVTLRRFPNIHIIVAPSQVQGKNAATEISENIKLLNRIMPDLDFVIIGRGGGSIEELWAFNEEILARAIFQSKIPIVSAVGHETDFTISDFVADLRAPTPSGAAEMTIPDKSSLVSHIEILRSKLKRMTFYLIELKKERFINLIENLKYQSPKNKILQYIQTIDDLDNRLYLSIRNIINLKESVLKNYREKLFALSPESILERGYSICFKIPGRKVVKFVEQVEKSELLEIRISNGSISANILEKEGIKYDKSKR